MHDSHASKKPLWNDLLDRKQRKYDPPHFGPTWEHDMTYPVRLGNFRYGFNVNVSVTDLAHAQAEYTRAEMLDILVSGIDHVRYMFYIEDVAAGGNNPAIAAGALACIRYVLTQFLQYGINVILQVGSNNTARADLAGDNGTGPTVWTQANYNKFLTNLFTQCQDVPRFTPETVWLGVGNEMGQGVSNRSIVQYEAFLASAITAIRTVAPYYTILYDLYPTGAADQWHFGSDFIRPTDKNTVCSVHYYDPLLFTSDQGAGSTAVDGTAYIYGFGWPMTNAEAGAYLATFTSGGRYGTGIAALDAQVTYWRIHYDTLLGSSRNLTNAAQDAYLAPLITWASLNKVALHCSEFGVSAAEGRGVSVMSEAAAAAWTAKISTMMNSLGIGNCYWQYQDLTTGVAGSRVLSAVKLARNQARRTLVNGIRSL